MERTAKANKILVLGVDGLDPRLTRKYVDMGLMPNTKKIIEKGAQRHDLTMLGGHPTVTPPMWTTLATGCYANVHGITGFFRNGKELGYHAYNLDSRYCKAEQIWNVFAEAGKKTLVWHWPGSSWPPSSDSENLYVVDGSSPGAVTMSVTQVESQFLVAASEAIPVVTFRPAAGTEAHAACVLSDIDVADANSDDLFDLADFLDMSKDNAFIMHKKAQMTSEATFAPYDLAQSPIKPATGWAAAPADAKEFVILLSNGLIRRPALVLKNENGIYDSVAIYKSKKESEPLVVCPVGEMIVEYVDAAYRGDEKIERTNRNIKLLAIEEDGSALRMFISGAMNMDDDSLWSPKRLHKEVVENIGFPPPNCNISLQDDELISECLIPMWTACAEWQAKSLNHLIKEEEFDAVFSHFHGVDAEFHQFIMYRADRPFNKNPLEVCEKWMQMVYVQTDNYVGEFLHLLDEGWAIIITSDHALVPAKHDLPMLFDMSGTCTPVMEELGYTVLKTDENGNKIGEIDWTKTRAVMQREGHIYLNIKGRNTHALADGTVIDGIVDPADQYELEEQIMTDLYGYKHKTTGHRICSVALRNREAVLLGQGGPEAGDICCWIAEGYNYDHADGLATTLGEGDTSLAPIFIAAGPGLKEGFETDRIIREIDLAPTVAVLGGVRMPAQCEGAPVYQILAEQY